MVIKAYAKINLILNVLGKRADGYHEVEMLMQAIDLCDLVTVEVTDPPEEQLPGQDNAHILGPQDFEYGQQDLAYKAALLMAEAFRPQLLANALDEDGLELAPGVNGVKIAIEKHIPAAAGLAGGSADAAAVMVGLGKLWLTEPGADEPLNAQNTDDQLKTQTAEDLLEKLLPLGAKLGSDVPFCIASQLGHPAAIARGRGTELEFVQPVDCALDLYFSGVSIPSKTRAVYAELKEEDCEPRFSIEAFLKASSPEEMQRLTGNHLQAPAERILANLARPANATLCGAGPTYFVMSESGKYRTVIR